MTYQNSDKRKYVLTKKHGKIFMIKLNLVCLVVETTRFIQNPIYNYYYLLKSVRFCFLFVFLLDLDPYYRLWLAMLII